jgi:hypothetical protein
MLTGERAAAGVVVTGRFRAENVAVAV